MPPIKTANDFLAAFGTVVDAADPIGELKRRGFTLPRDLDRVVGTPAARALFMSQERQRLLAERRGRRPPRLQIGRLPRPNVVPLLPGGHHDLTIGLKLEKANEILTGSFATRAIPRDVFLPDHVSADSLATLLDVLRAELLGVPQGDDVRIGALHIVAPPTVSALPTRSSPGQPVDPTARLQVHLPIALDLDRVSADGPREPAISTVRAIAHFGIAVDARVDGAELLIAAGALPRPIGAGDPEFMQIEITADSPHQPRTSTSEKSIALAIELGGFQGVLRELAISTTIAPRIRLPIGPGFDIVVRHIDLRAVPSGTTGHLMVGLEIGAEPPPVPLTGQPELLERDPFTEAEATVYIEAHAELFRVLVKQLFASGELERLAKERAANLELDAAEAELGTNTIGVRLEGKLVDECGVFGQNFIDVNFDGLQSVVLTKVESGTLRFEDDETLGIGDASAGDIAACIALSFLDLKILSFAKAAFDALMSKVSGWLFGTGVGAGRIVEIFAPNVPIPTTELLPRLSALAASIDSTDFRIQARLDLVPDAINTYVYVKCEHRALPRFGTGIPVANARVRLLDQDVPPPAGDDARVPRVGTTETRAGNFRMRTVDVTFEPSPSDQELASGTTDSEGRVQLVISPGRLATSAGVETIVTVVEDTQTGEIISSDVRRRRIHEPRPDVYFLIEVPGGGRLDSRSVPGGFIRNLNTKRWGTAAEPLVFNVPRPLIGEIQPV